MADILEDLEVKEQETPDLQPEPVVVKKGGFLGKFLTFLFGIFMGIVLVVGGIAGAGYFVYTRPIKKTLDLIDSKGTLQLYDKLFNSENGYLNEKYAEMTVGDLLKDVIGAASAFSSDGSLNSLHTISPKVGSLVSKLLDKTNPYGIPLEKDTLMEKPITELPSYLTGQLKDTPIGGLLEGTTGAPVSDSILLAICYGEEGVDYYLDAEGKVVMLDGKQPATVSDIIEGDGMSSIVNDLPLASVVDINLNDATMCTIAYGPKSHYKIETIEGKQVVTMLPMVFTYEDKTEDGEDNKLLYDVDGDLAEGTFDADAKTLTLDDGTVYYLSLQETRAAVETYSVYHDAEKTKLAYYQKTKIEGLGSNSAAIIDDLTLSDALNVNNASHRVIISLAYGNEGEDYTVNEGGTINPVSKPRTIGDLKTNSQEIIDGILLKDALTITAESHPVLISLAYGEYTVETVDGVEVIKPAAGAKPRTLGELSTNSTALIDSIYLDEALSLNENSHPIMKSLVKDKDGNRRTLGDLSQNSQEIIEEIPLTDVLDVDMSSNLTMYLLYGREGVHYEINPDDSITMLAKKIAHDGTKVYNEYGEELVGWTLVDGNTITHTYEGESGNVTDTYKLGALPVDAPVKEVKLPDGSHATLYFLLDAEGVSVGNYEPHTLGTLKNDNLVGNATKRLTVTELLGEETIQKHFVLKHLAEETIDTLPDAIDKLTIVSVYEQDIYMTKTEELPDGTNRVYFVDQYGIETTNPDEYVMKGVWKYMLTPQGESVPNRDYTIKQIGVLTDNVIYNIQHASLNDLHNDKIITNLDDTLLSKPVLHDIYIPTTDPSKTTIGQLEISELLEYVGALIPNS